MARLEAIFQELQQANSELKDSLQKAETSLNEYVKEAEGKIARQKTGLIVLGGLTFCTTVWAVVGAVWAWKHP